MQPETNLIGSYDTCRTSGFILKRMVVSKNWVKGTESKSTF